MLIPRNHSLGFDRTPQYHLASLLLENTSILRIPYEGDSVAVIPQDILGREGNSVLLDVVTCDCTVQFSREQDKDKPNGSYLEAFCLWAHNNGCVEEDFIDPILAMKLSDTTKTYGFRCVRGTLFTRKLPRGERIVYDVSFGGEVIETPHTLEEVERSERAIRDKRIKQEREGTSALKNLESRMRRIKRPAA